MVQIQPVETEKFLVEEGFTTPEARELARELLITNGLTRPHKKSFDPTKIPKIRESIRKNFVQICSDICLHLISDEDKRKPIVVAKEKCEVCRNSNLKQKFLKVSRLFERRGVKRLLVVGGSNTYHTQLRDLFAGTGVETRFVEGDNKSHSTKQVLANKNWTQVIVIWGPTILRHNISDMYLRGDKEGFKLIVVRNRGLGAFFEELIQTFSK